MPVEFLTDDQAASCGRFTGVPTQVELERFCFLDDADLALIAQHRGDHSKLGFGLQLATVRALGTFLADPLDVPTVVVDYVAAQVDVADPSCVKPYAPPPPTQFLTASIAAGMKHHLAHDLAWARALCRVRSRSVRSLIRCSSPRGYWSGAVGSPRAVWPCNSAPGTNIGRDRNCI
jgi:hypothetical protein